MMTFLKEFRYAVRQLRRSLGFTLTAIITLALGIGAAAAIYSVIYNVLLQPLPYPDSDRLVGLAFTYPRERPNAEQTGGSADFLREHSNAFASVSIMDDNGPAVNLSVNGGRAVQINSLRVSAGYFRTLGVMPAMGRVFLPEEDRPGGGKPVIISSALWANILGRDPEIIGRGIRINQEAFTVVGVMPAQFAVTAETAPGVLGTPDIWQPIQLGPKDPGYDGDNYEMIGRLRDGVTIAQVQQQIHALNQPFYQQNPQYLKWRNTGNSATGLHEYRIWKLQDVMVSQVRRSLLTLMAAVLAVLLVACLNLSGLMIARTMRRSRELALRSALGATRAQLVRMLACEGLVLAISGGLLALLVARASAHILLRAAPLAVPSLRGEPSLWLLSAVVLVIAMLATGTFSLLPASFILFKKDRQMRLGGPSLGETVSHARLSRALMVAQISLAMVLVSTASVLLGTFVKLRSVPSGVEPKRLSVFQVSLKGEHYANTMRTTQFVRTVLQNLKRTPGVDSVAAVNGLPLDRGLNIGGNPTDRHDIRQIIEFRSVTPGYFQTMGIPLLAGRDIVASDKAGGDLVIVVGAETARKWWPGQSAIGKSIKVGGERNWRIIGVVADTHTHSLVETGDMLIYAPIDQLSDEFSGIINGWFPTTFAVRTAANVNIAAAAQQSVTLADTEIPVARLTTMQAVIDSSIQQPRFFSLLAGSFSVFALVLTIIGLFGLLSYQVTQRTREIGVRMALGADRGSILRTFLNRGVAVGLVGIAIGLAASWMMRAIVGHLLADAGIDAANGAAGVVMSGVQAAVVAALTILFSTLAASWLPARRAASIEPMQALRAE